MFDSSSEAAIRKAAEAFNNAPKGTIIVVPTDTVYCLAAKASDAEGIRNLYVIKNRPAEKPVSLWFSESKMKSSLRRRDFTDQVWSVMQKAWPGQTSLVINKFRGLDQVFPEWRTVRCGTVDGEDGELGRANSIAMRIPDCVVLNRFMDLVGPLAITSANPSGAIDVNDWTETINMITTCKKVPVLGVLMGQVARSFGQTGEMASSVINMKDWEDKDAAPYEANHVCGKLVKEPTFLRKGVNTPEIERILSETFPRFRA